MQAGIARVVAAVEDPHREVDGRGIARLRAAGVAVTVGVRRPRPRRLNRAFFSAMTEGRPHVTLKTAMTLDGKIAAADGASRWITGEAARLEAHRLRFAADAILVGIGTVLADDPQLDGPAPGLPRRSRSASSSTAGCAFPSTRASCVRAIRRAPLSPASRRRPPDRSAALRARGVHVLELPGDAGRVDLRALLDALRSIDVIAVLVEGGGELGGALAEAGLVDRVAFFVAPRLVGGAAAPGPLGGRGRPLKDALALVDVTTRRIGDDLLVEADVLR